MKVTKQKIRKHRVYSEPFKKEIVRIFESGEFSVPQLEKLYSIRNSLIYNWIYKYSTFNEKGFRVVEMKQSNSQKLKELADKVKELERIVGQKQIKIDYLEKIISIAEDELNIEIKKKSDTSQSTGSKKTAKN